MCIFNVFIAGGTGSGWPFQGKMDESADSGWCLVLDLLNVVEILT